MGIGYEVNFDGIVGPTHNYAGLSFGNIASLDHEKTTSLPKQAALEGLEKMKFLSDLGIYQAVLPPHERPHLPTLKTLGFTGSDADIIAKAYKETPEILSECYSASAMWTANAATVSPSIDSLDKHVHFTPANLSNKFHRSIEAETTSKILKKIFDNDIYFRHHPPLLPGNHFSDEGAANHARFCKHYGGLGIQLFVFGRYAFRENALEPIRYPARQTFEACDTISRLHQLSPDHALIIQQNPRAIDAGMFHNDVIFTSNCDVLLYHEAAFVASDVVINEIHRKVSEYCGAEMSMIMVPEEKVPLEDVVKSYLFNSQIVSLHAGGMTFIAPTECKEVHSVHEYLKEMVDSPTNPIAEIHYVNLRQSMHNGGGPACLRLRVVLTENEINATNKAVFFNDRLYKRLQTWINKHYRDELNYGDLVDPRLVIESREALDELTKILDLGSIYDFQQ